MCNYRSPPNWPFTLSQRWSNLHKSNHVLTPFAHILIAGILAANSAMPITIRQTDWQWLPLITPPLMKEASSPIHRHPSCCYPQHRMGCLHGWAVKQMFIWDIFHGYLACPVICITKAALITMLSHAFPSRDTYSLFSSIVCLDISQHVGYLRGWAVTCISKVVQRSVIKAIIKATVNISVT